MYIKEFLKSNSAFKGCFHPSTPLILQYQYFSNWQCVNICVALFIVPILKCISIFFNLTVSYCFIGFVLQPVISLQWYISQRSLVVGNFHGSRSASQMVEDMSSGIPLSKCRQWMHTFNESGHTRSSSLILKQRLLELRGI